MKEEKTIYSVSVGALAGLFIGFPAWLASEDFGHLAVALLSGSVSGYLVETVRPEDRKTRNKKGLSNAEVVRKLSKVAEDYGKLPSSSGYSLEAHSSILQLLEHYKEQDKN
ncbi:hypothetical protein [Floridanema aerugineum]|uniref:Holin n=1 Tax=Floridaenema aerugineum BLCC-F46 TaxID=3153654 RepID=A0ABV4X291_9CYAN